MDIAFVIVITSGIILAYDFPFINIDIKIIKLYFVMIENKTLLIASIQPLSAVFALGRSHPIQWLCHW